MKSRSLHDTAAAVLVSTGAAVDTPAAGTESTPTRPMVQTVFPHRMSGSFRSRPIRLHCREGRRNVAAARSRMARKGRDVSGGHLLRPAHGPGPVRDPSAGMSPVAPGAHPRGHG